jgi:hypothetical protein
MNISLQIGGAVNVRVAFPRAADETTNKASAVMGASPLAGTPQVWFRFLSGSRQLAQVKSSQDLLIFY